MAQKVLQKAKQAKKDEFYTQSKDIEDELRHYKAQFRDIVVYCNCDDPFESNFFKYFVLNFKHLGLKSLITTSYKPSPIANTQLGLFGDNKTVEESKGRPKVTANRFIINDVGDINGDGSYNLKDVAEQLKANKNNEWSSLEGEGDFRSAECVELLKQADIVVTNPPFSLFREYIAQLVEHDKKFLIIGNTNALTYKEIFQLFKDNNIRTGYTNFNVGMFFVVPSDWEQFHHLNEVGEKLARVSTSCWFTNLDVEKHKEDITLYRKYTPNDYPVYANYDAIEVAKVSNIPMDFIGEMGVPITFLDKYNPSQFEIIGSSITLGKPMSKIAEKGTYVQGGPSFYIEVDNSRYQRLYHRVIIKNKKVTK